MSNLSWFNSITEAVFNLVRLVESWHIHLGQNWDMPVTATKRSPSRRYLDIYRAVMHSLKFSELNSTARARRTSSVSVLAVRET